jgi:hypothetical protein
MRISRLVAAGAITGAAMATALGALQLTSGGSHPAVNRPAVSVNHGSQADFGTDNRSPEEIRADLDQAEADLHTLQQQCTDALNQAPPEAKLQIATKCKEQIDPLQQRIENDEAALAQAQHSQPQDPSQPRQDPQPQTSPSAG